MNYQYKHLGLWNGEYRGEGSTGTVWLFEIISGRLRLPFASSFVCQTLPLENLPPERNTSVTPPWAVSSESEIKAEWKPAWGQIGWGGGWGGGRQRVSIFILNSKSFGLSQVLHIWPTCMLSQVGGKGNKDKRGFDWGERVTDELAFHIRRSRVFVQSLTCFKVSPTDLPKCP